MKGIINRMKGEISVKLKFFRLALFAFLMLGSYTGQAQNLPATENSEVSYSEMSERVNINIADAETIAMMLDGVGLSRAEAIVDYRESNGDFKSVDELIMVSGIGEVTLRNNVDKITLVEE